MFTPRRVSDLEPQIHELCHQLLDPLVGEHRFDLITEFGQVMPTQVIGMLVGIPEQDRATVRDYYRTEPGIEDILSGSIYADYIDWRAEHPSDDIMTHLMYTEFEDETGVTRRLTREELLAYVAIVASAGNDTTKRLIGWTGKVLADHPDQRQVLVEDPSLISNAVEEILRFEPPAPHGFRYVVRDVELYGQVVPEGSLMCMLTGSANRDERYYPDPNRFDVRRDTSHHFSFGFGAHYCLGQALARLEGRVALEEILKRFPEWDVDMETAKFAYDGDLRGWDALPVVIT
jgi:cytochrome P450